MLSLTTVLLFGSLVSHALAAPALTSRGVQATQKLYARADVLNPVKNIHVHFEFTGRTDGTGTYVKVSGLSGLTNNPDLGGPFSYHIHTNVVPSDGNCSRTLAHLDPLLITESLICNPAFPEYCQEGDLSGKHGKLNGTSTGLISAFGYSDDYLRFFPQDLSILGRSIVIHSSNKTRLACGNITSALDGTADAGWNPTFQASSYVTNYPSQAPPNPPQVITPFVGTVFPGDDVLHNLPFALANKALPIYQALNVRFDPEVDTQVWINGTQTTVKLPKETKIEDAPPFQGVTDIY